MTPATDSPARVHPMRTLCLAGPTATGKTEGALFLAERLGAEIISVDSMQVYRGLDIGTAKPTEAERERVRHHLLDVVDLNQTFSVVDFLRLSSQAAQEIPARGRVPLFCGGTGFYFKALVHGVGEAPPTDPVLRAELDATPLPNLLAELAQSDPATYGRIDRNNPRRVVRAVEVVRLTGKPWSEQRASWTVGGGEPEGAFVLIGLRRQPRDLWRRIDSRVELMFHHGLVAETAELLGRGLAANRTAMQALGYRQVVEHLRGVRSLEQTIQLVKIRTRQFAKRQMTWFRNQLNVRWIQVEAGDSASETATKVVAEFSQADKQR